MEKQNDRKKRIWFLLIQMCIRDREMDLEIASEFLLIAATLLNIKVRMLLPKQKSDENDADSEEDPRAELVRRLVAVSYTHLKTRRNFSVFAQWIFLRRQQILHAGASGV